jgi:hypothetical protein
MTRRANISKLICVTIGFVLSTTLCAAAGRPIVFEPLEADLNGDGHRDTIVFVCYDPYSCFGQGNSSYERFILDIESCFVISRGNNLDGVFHVVDIDTTDAYEELAVPESGQSGDFATQFYYFTGDSIIFMGTLPGTYDLKVNGSGQIQTMRRGSILHTWFYPASYTLTDSHHLEFVRQDLYIMNQPVTLRSDLALQKSPTDSALAVVLHPGQKGTIVGSDDRRWCLFETEDGIKGWFAVERFSRIVGTHKRASDVFDGLSYAD